MAQGLYKGAAVAVLAAHLLWILWVILGALPTRHRGPLAWVHILSLGYGIAIVTGPWPCPLTALEQYLQRQAGITPYRQNFLVHYLEALVYPDIPENLLTGCAVAVCLFNLCVYVVRFRLRKQRAAPRPVAPPVERQRSDHRTLAGKRD